MATTGKLLVKFCHSKNQIRTIIHAEPREEMNERYM